MLIILKYPRTFGAKETTTFLFEVYSVPGVLPHHDILEIIFDNFNHGSKYESKVFLESRLRNLSVGDFVGLEGVWYQCAGSGWRKRTLAEVDAVMALPEYMPWLKF